jgi:hypothetical protein
MDYDYTLHEYVLTAEAVKKYLGLDVVAEFRTVQAANAELIKQSMEVYAYMYSAGLRGNKPQIEYLIATGGQYRVAIFHALLGQCEYAMESRGNLVPLQHGVLLSKGTVIPLELLRGDVQVSLRTVQSLSEAGLLYGGKLGWVVPSAMYRVGY